MTRDTSDHAPAGNTSTGRAPAGNTPAGYPSAEQRSAAAEPTEAVSVQDLTYTYAGSSEPAVRGMDFTVGPGEVFGFLGPSGAGKSTTQKILIGLLTGHGGRVSVLGADPAAAGQDHYRNIGVSFELPNHYQKLTALENLELFAQLHDGAATDPRELLDAVGLAADARTKVGRFSKGMQVRLGFARALLHGPALLFLDEPTSGLDPRNARRILDLVLEQKARGTTVFLTTHDMATADELCDRVAFVVDGRIAALDAPKELKVARSQRAVRVEYRTGSGELAAAEFDLDGLADDAAFRELVRTQRVETLHSQEATLDDVFVETTGRSLR
ncbi:ABC transporter ATP-binding protein [Salinifilum aidingensis]